MQALQVSNNHDGTRFAPHATGAQCTQDLQADAAVDSSSMVCFYYQVHTSMLLNPDLPNHTHGCFDYSQYFCCLLTLLIIANTGQFTVVVRC